MISKPWRGGEVDQLRLASHGAVVADDLANHPHRRLPGQAAEIDRRFGMPGALQHAPLAGNERKHVAGTDEITRRDVRVGQQARGAAAVGGGDAGGDAGAGIDGDSERGAVRILVRGHHRRQPERFCPLPRHRHADQPARFTHHQVQHFGGGEIGDGDQITFILASLVVHHNDAFPGGQIRQRIFHAGKSAGRILIIRKHCIHHTCCDSTFGFGRDKACPVSTTDESNAGVARNPCCQGI